MATVLLVEDEKILAEMYKDKFESEGIKIILAFSTEEALEALQKERPDLILLDILLPRQNGIAFLQKFQTMKNQKDVPVIAFSNYDDPRTKKEALELGAKEYIIKTNYTPREIVEKVKKYLNI